jgi:peroxiredoxin
MASSLVSMLFMLLLVGGFGGYYYFVVYKRMMSPEARAAAFAAAGYRPGEAVQASYGGTLMRRDAREAASRCGTLRRMKPTKSALTLVLAASLAVGCGSPPEPAAASNDKTAPAGPAFEAGSPATSPASDDESDMLWKGEPMKGKPAPGLDGKPIKGAPTAQTLAALKGKVVLVLFFASWSPPSIKRLTAVEDLLAKHSKAGLVAIAVSEDGAVEDIEHFLAKKPKGAAEVPFVHDADKKLSKAWQDAGPPHTFIVDRSGVVRKGMRMMAPDDRDLKLIGDAVAKLL